MKPAIRSRQPMTVCVSLSPRPDRHTTIKLVLLHLRRDFQCPGTACALSRAGMMPSWRDKTEASTASLIGHRDMRCPAGGREIGMLGPTRIVKIHGRNGISVTYLTVTVLQQICFIAVQNTDLPAVDACGVQAVSCRVPPPRHRQAPHPYHGGTRGTSPARLSRPHAGQHHIVQTAFMGDDLSLVSRPMTA